jgi:CelD/BcsL family acetyltransferase involved in cellulose biosynthesis
MTLAPVIESRSGARAGSRASSIARVDVLHDPGEGEAVWRSLERSGRFSPYQRFDILAAWQDHIGAADGQQPFIVIAYDAHDQPLLLMPLVTRQRNRIRIAQFFGGKHITFNMPLWQRDFAAGAGRGDMDALLAGISRHAGKVDVLALARQPKQWAGVANPMALLPHQASINDCPVLTMVAGAPPTERVSASFRRRLKSKEKKFQALPGYRYGIVTTDAAITRVLDFFFTVKPVRMAEQKLPNVFAEPGVEDFIRSACLTPLADGGHAIDVHALECDDEVIAMFAGVADAGRFSMMFNTYTLSSNAKYSPGLILMRNIIDFYAARGVTSLDLGIGSDDYKRLFCKDDEPIFDSFIPLTARGRLAAIGLSSLARVKRLVKHTPALMQMAYKLRGMLSR